MEFKLFDKYKLQIDEILKKNLYLIIFILCLIRIFYVSSFNNETVDIYFYNKITEGILSGCGFSTVSSSGKCSPVVGHFFPAFHYLLSLFYLLNLKIKSLVIFISIIQFSSFLNLYFTIKKYFKKSLISIFLLIYLSISPLTLGFSRLILIEPLITAFGIYFLSKLISIYFEGFTKINFINIVIIQTIALYFKPIAILFSIPLIILAFNKLKFKIFLRTTFIWFTVLLMLISPWGIRNISYGAKSPYTSVLESNFYPKYTNGYISWLSTWVITEHEQAINGFIVSNPPFNLSIKKARLNPFISDEEIALINDKYENINSFSSDDDFNFNKLANLRKNKLGFFGNLSLYFLKSTSLLLNPLNSWGWPIEISSRININNIQNNSNSYLLSLVSEPRTFFNLTFKILLFFYRLILFYLFFKFTFNQIKIEGFSITKSNSFSSFMAFSTLFLLLGTLYLFAIHFPSLEHRFISIIIPWVEMTNILFHYRK